MVGRGLEDVKQAVLGSEIHRGVGPTVRGPPGAGSDLAAWCHRHSRGVGDRGLGDCGGLEQFLANQLLITG